MLKLRNKSAQPRSKRQNPAYPRVLGVSLAFALAACGGQAVDNGAEGEGGAGGEGGYGGEIAGGMPESYDAGPEAQVEEAAPPAYDGGQVDAQPPPDGDIAPPFDAGVDAWVEPDAEIGGGIPAPFDAGEDAYVEPDAELGGAAPGPFDGGQY